MNRFTLVCLLALSTIFASSNFYGNTTHPKTEDCENTAEETTALYGPINYTGSTSFYGSTTNIIPGLDRKLSSFTVKNLISGSIIIDMGSNSPDFDNGLKPYGLIYSIIKNYSIPVYWSINPNKGKDGIDFTVDGIDFRGGPFIISQEYLTTAILAEIQNWENDGVIIHETSTTVEIPVYQELTYFPTWVLDEKNGKIAEKYLKNAGIPSDAYIKALPTELNDCHDLFVLPHAEPTWDKHGNLLDWNSPIAEGGNQGYIWSGCTAASNLENLYNPNNPSEQLNFLALKTRNAFDNGDDYFENALVLADNHEDASNTTHDIDFHTDPFMQFIGQSDGVHKGGKEEIYLPVKGGGWRPTTKVSIWDTNQEDLGTLSDGKAALMVYGPAFGDENRGQIMYQAGHDLNKDGSTAERVAAQRGFLNFSFDAASAKVPEIVLNTPLQREITLANGESITFEVTGVPIAGGSVTYEWSTSCAIGSFDNPNSPNPTFTIPSTPQITEGQTCIVTVKVTDECGRLSFLTYIINLIDEPVVCSIDGITAANPSDCNDNGTGNTADDFFTADITITFTNPPSEGFLQLSGDGNGIIPVAGLDSDTSHTFIGVELPTNGNTIQLSAFFINGEEETECDFVNANVITAPESCSFTPCAIDAITAANTSDCNDNGTATTDDDFFTTDITVSFTNPPAEGFLQLSGAASGSVSISNLDSNTSHTFQNIQLPANGQVVQFSALFLNGEEETACEFTDAEVLIAPESCFIPCSIDAITAANTSDCNNNGTATTDDDFFTTDITVSFTNPPSEGFLQLSGAANGSVLVGNLDSNTSHTFQNIQLPANGQAVQFSALFLNGEEETACEFADPEVLIAPESCFIPCSIDGITANNSSSCNDNGTGVSDDDFFTADITVSFVFPPAEGFLQLTGDGNAVVAVSGLDSTTSHTFIGVELPADGSTIQLSALFLNGEEEGECYFVSTNVITAPESCSVLTCSIDAIAANNTSSCNDNGTATTDDDFFTTNITVSFTNPPSEGFLQLSGAINVSVLVSNLDSATSHTFQNLQLPANGQAIQLSALFLNGEEETECDFVNSQVLVAPESCFTPCSIDAITAANTSDCNNNGTGATNDDFFTTDITVSFTNPPAEGFLQLSGAVNESVLVSNLDSDTSHTFQNVQLPANGQAVQISALFLNGEEETACEFADAEVLIAPESCATRCSINGIIASNGTSCNDNGTANPDDNFFTVDITVSFESAPSRGYLQLTGDTTSMVNINELDSATSHTFVGVTLPADGEFVELTAAFVENDQSQCEFTNTTVVSAPLCCAPVEENDTCSISDVVIGDVSCSTVDDPKKNSTLNKTYNANITVTFDSAPNTGFLKLITNNVVSIVGIGNLDNETSHTFDAVIIESENQLVEISAFFITGPEVNCAFNKAIFINCNESEEGSTIENPNNFKGMNVHPNPSTGKITIDTPNVSGNVNVDIYDLLGRKIMTKYVNPEKKSIEINELPKGVLLLRVKSKTESFVKKIIIE